MLNQAQPTGCPVLIFSSAAKFLIDSNGDWFLCDFDSCTWKGARHAAKLTSNYIPSDLNRTVGRRFDRVLLAVPAVVLVNPEALKLGNFKLKDLETALRVANVPAATELLDDSKKPSDIEQC